MYRTDSESKTNLKKQTNKIQAQAMPLEMRLKIILNVPIVKMKLMSQNIFEGTADAKRNNVHVQ